jgi:hypothetical protein
MIERMHHLSLKSNHTKIIERPAKKSPRAAPMSSIREAL